MAGAEADGSIRRSLITGIRFGGGELEAEEGEQERGDDKPKDDEDEDKDGDGEAEDVGGAASMTSSSSSDSSCWAICWLLFGNAERVDGVEGV